MNKIIIKGRLSHSPELKTTTTGKEVCEFSVAVDRAYNREETDFFTCKAWGKTGVFVNQYFTKGQEILLSGEMQQRKWQTDSGENRYAWEIIVDNVEFCGSKKDGGGTVSQAPTTAAVTIENVGDFEEIDDDEDVPF